MWLRVLGYWLHAIQLHWWGSLSEERDCFLVLYPGFVCHLFRPLYVLWRCYQLFSIELVSTLIQRINCNNSNFYFFNQKKFLRRLLHLPPWVPPAFVPSKFSSKSSNYETLENCEILVVQSLSWYISSPLESRLPPLPILARRFKVCNHFIFDIISPLWPRSWWW